MLEHEIKEIVNLYSVYDLSNSDWEYDFLERKLWMGIIIILDREEYFTLVLVRKLTKIKSLALKP